MRRLTVFVDHQNVYMEARRCFGLDHGPARFGQVHPAEVGEVVEARRNQRYRGTEEETELREVRVYRGMPDGAMDPKAHGAVSRQIHHWQRRPDVRVLTHPIAYPRGWADERRRADIARRGGRPREKGIDVQLAVDLVLGAVHDEYDVGVVFSADQDLLPALRASMALGKHIEVAAWRARRHAVRRIPGRDLPPHPDGRPRTLWCHQLDEDDFALVRDDTSYTRPLPGGGTGSDGLT